MSSRTIAVLVAVAVVAGIGVAAYGFTTRGSSKTGRTLQIDEVNGRVGKVVLGETRENVIGVLGKPLLTRDLPVPGYVPETVIAYPHLWLDLRNGQVTSIRTDDPAAQTNRVVRIGDPLSAVRASYRKAARCNPNSPDKTAKHPGCNVKVPVGVLLVGGDPIKSMTLVRSR